MVDLLILLRNRSSVCFHPWLCRGLYFYLLGTCDSQYHLRPAFDEHSCGYIIVRFKGKPRVQIYIGHRRQGFLCYRAQKSHWLKLCGFMSKKGYLLPEKERDYDFFGDAYTEHCRDAARCDIIYLSSTKKKKKEGVNPHEVQRRRQAKNVHVHARLATSASRGM